MEPAHVRPSFGAEACCALLPRSLCHPLQRLHRVVRGHVRAQGGNGQRLDRRLLRDPVEEPRGFFMSAELDARA